MTSHLLHPIKRSLASAEEMGQHARDSGIGQVALSYQAKPQNETELNDGKNCQKKAIKSDS